MNIKKILLSFFILAILTIITDIIANILNIRPTQIAYGWKDSHTTYKSVQKTITKNEFGTRDTKKNNAKKNIILLGDSQIETSHDAKKMPARILENYLNDEYNVYSLGSWGWGNDQQLLILREVIEKINPEFVILWASYNDFNDNYHHIGFNGEKPTFKISDDLKIQEPFFPQIRKFLTYSWFYRVIIRIKLKYNLKKVASENKILGSNKLCEEKNYEDLRFEVYDFDFQYKEYLNQGIIDYRRVDIGKQNSKISKEKFIESYYYLIRNNNNENYIDRYYLFREKKNILEKKKQYLTKYLVEEIQKTSNNYKAKFILFNIFNYNELFKTENIYTMCFNGNEVNYSNIFRKKYIDDTYKNIKYKIFFNIPRGAIYYDNFDGHINYEYNKKAVKLIYQKILELINM